MEDILASIRKIIADDSDPVPLDGPTAAGAPDALRPAPVPVPVDAAPLELTEMADQADADALDIEALLSDIQVAEPETPPAVTPADDPGGVPQFTSASPAPGLDDELSIPETPVEAAAPAPAASDSADDDVDRLMSELLTEMEELPTGVMATPPAEAETQVVETHAVEDVTTHVTLDAGSDDELDLVKSLMADLTDEDETEAPDMLAVESTVAAEGALDIDVADSIEAPEVDILDSILDMTLADEVATGPDDAQTALVTPDMAEVEQSATTVEAAQSVTVETVIQDVTVETDMAETDPAPSLSDIAAAAEEDVAGEFVVSQADTDIDEPSPDDADVADAVAMLSGEHDSEVADTVDADAEADAVLPDPALSGDTSPETLQSTPDDTPELETSMPRAVRSDAILDDVTEEATMTAFAQLNQAVEDKAILSERGPRIGDLVQDALKPMLKEWLDENLQAIVERAVAKEVKRLSSGK
ncbi:MAG: DUF2497 domain-containing protein [Pseudomonadota bacterium]